MSRSGGLANGVAGSTAKRCPILETPARALFRALGSAFAVVMVNMLVQALAFRNRGPTALHEGYPLLILFGVTAWMAALSKTRDRNS